MPRSVVVLFIQSPFYGGPERQMIGLAHALRSDYEAVFFCFDEHGRSRPLLDVAQAQGFRTVTLRHDKPNFPAMIGEAAQRLREVEAKVVCAHNYKASLIGLAAARRVGIPCVGVSHGWTRETPQVILYESLERLALRRMDAVVGVSGAQAEKVVRAGVPPERVHVIRNALDAPARLPRDPAMRASLEALFAQAPARIVGAAGRLSFEKGFDQLVLAAELVRAQDPGAGFVIFGEGVQRAALERSIAERNLRETVILGGFRRDLDRVLPALDIVVLPSRSEGLPVIALEAMAAEVPVVATAVGGTPEAVADGVCGYVVPPEMPSALAQALVTLLQSAQERHAMGARGRERVLADFTFARQAAQYVALFAALSPA